MRTKQNSKQNFRGIVLLTIRSILVLILLIVMISTQLSEKISTTPLDEMTNRVVSSINIGNKMEKSSNRMFKKIYGLNASDYDGVVFYKPVSGMAAQEMLLVKLKNVKQSDQVVEAIERRLNSQKNSFEGYGVEQTALLEQAVLDARGNYILYIVHESAREADHVFKDSL